MLQERPDVRYNLLAVDFMPEAVLATHLSAVATGLAAGRLTPFPRIRHRLGGVVSALRQMSQAQHVGKVVVARGKASETPYHELGRPAVVVSGGTGMLGQTMASWLLESQVSCRCCCCLEEESHTTPANYLLLA